ncbi:hypothetical protein LXL04_016900 [Taraxacum kok-saghyz]
MMNHFKPWNQGTNPSRYRHNDLRPKKGFLKGWVQAQPSLCPPFLEPDDNEFTVLAKIVQVDHGSGWCYASCSKYNKSVDTIDGSFVCSICNQECHYPIIRSTVSVMVWQIILEPPVEPAMASASDAPAGGDKAATPTALVDTPEWKRTDSIVKSWLYGTLSSSLLHLIFKKQDPAHEVWHNIEKVFRDNKANKVIQIDNELRNITMGDSSITDYCNRVKSLADLLDNMDSTVPEVKLVAYLLNGLSQKYRYIATTIRH